MQRQTCGEILRRCAPQNDTPQDHSDAVLEDYTLNPLHRDGRSKARVFESVLGITLPKADVLRHHAFSVAGVLHDLVTRLNRSPRKSARAL